MKYKATIEIEDVTPEQAASYLEKMHPNQRHLRDSWVQRLIGEMKNGSFKLSCDALAFVGGVLHNGQHRLQACARSRVTCKFLVLRSEDPNLYKIIDAGIKRNVADCIVGEHRSSVAAVSSWILQYDCKSLTQSTRRCSANQLRELLRSRQIEFIDKHRDRLQEVAKATKAMWKMNKFLQPSMAGAIMFLGDRERKDDSGTRFIQAVYAGVSNDATKDVRDKMINDRLSKRKLAAPYKFGLLIKAFKSWEQGTRPSDMRLRETEEFPSFDIEPKKIK